MVNVVSAVSSAQNASLKPSVQSSLSTTPAPPPPLSSIDFVTSEIYVDNLQNIAILEYRSSQTGQVVQQYPNQAQINAFKAAQRLADQATTSHQTEAAAHEAAAAAAATQEAGTTDHVSAAPATTSEDTGGSGASTAETGSSGGRTTSVVA